MTPKISIIVPMYNVEKYLAKCLDSLLNQTHQNLDIVLVDDGSSDKTLEIANEYHLKDSRITVIHTDNYGVSHARNTGMKHASGEFILFIDSDDFIKENLVEVLLTYAQKNNADVAVGRIIGTTAADFEFDDCFLPAYEVWNNEQALQEMLRTGKTSMYPVSKLIRRDLISNIEFDLNLKLAEDAVFITQMYLKRDFTTVFVDEILYAYFQRQGSATKSPDLTYVFDTKIAYKYITSALAQKYPSLTPELVNRKNWANLEVYDKIAAYGDITSLEARELESEIKKSYGQICKDPLFTIGRKLALTLLFLSRGMYQRVVKRKKEV